MLVLVFILMNEARKPQNWQWLWGGASAASASIDQPIAARSESAGADGYFPGIAPADLARVRDNSVFLSSETEVWDRWLRLVNEAPQSALQRASIGHVGYVQLFHQTAEFRGRIVKVAGRVRRANYVAAPENAARVEGYWQCWLFTGKTSSSPVVVYTLQMPEGFPTGMEINEQVEFMGLVYKRWAYQSGSGIRLAPLLLAKRGSWTPSIPETRQALPGPWAIVSAIVIAAGLGISAAWMFWARSRGGTSAVRSRDAPPQDILPGRDEISAWNEPQNTPTQPEDLA